MTAHHSETANEAVNLDLQLMWNRLITVVEAQAQALLRTAFSTIVRESADLSAGVFDRRGAMLAQSVTGTPGHVNTMMESVLHFLDRFPPDTMREGDVFLTNDPWLGTGHLFDLVVMTPCFLAGELVGFFASTSHTMDVGGMGFVPDATDVFMEGLNIPPCRIVRAGELDDTLVSIMRANSRLPDDIEGDLHSLIAANETGCRALIAAMEEYRLSDLDELSDYILDRSRRAMENAIRALPDGQWASQLRLDGYESPIDLAASLTCSDGRIHVDLAGTSLQSRYGINVPLCYTKAYLVYGLACVLGPQIPNNSGSLAPFEVTAPPGVIVNAQRPAPVTSRHMIGHLMPDLVFGCLRQIIPDRVPSESTSTVWHMVFSGRASAEAAISLSTLTATGGMGGRPGLDGLSATGFPSGVSGTPIEIVEQGGTVLVLRKELREGSGGDGEFRGGDGLSIAITSANEQPLRVFAVFDRINNPPRGVDGGKNGLGGKISLSSGREIRAKGAQTIEAGEVLFVETPGGAGLGTPTLAT